MWSTHLLQANRENQLVGALEPRQDFGGQRIELPGHRVVQRLDTLDLTASM